MIKREQKLIDRVEKRVDELENLVSIIKYELDEHKQYLKSNYFTKKLIKSRINLTNKWIDDIKAVLAELGWNND